MDFRNMKGTQTVSNVKLKFVINIWQFLCESKLKVSNFLPQHSVLTSYASGTCNRLTKLSVTMWNTFFGKFDDTSLWILPKTHDPSLCDTPDDVYLMASQWRHQVLGEILLFWQFLVFEKNWTTHQIPTMQAA